MCVCVCVSLFVICGIGAEGGEGRENYFSQRWNKKKNGIKGKNVFFATPCENARGGRGSSIRPRLLPARGSPQE